MKSITIAFFAILFALQTRISASLELAPWISNNLVIQRDMPIKLWGWDNAGASVSAEIGGKSATAKADQSGFWKIELGALGAGGPHTLTIKGSTTATINNVLIGDIWVCSGQSNMESIGDGEPVKATQTYEQIRLCKISKNNKTGSGPQLKLLKVPAQWKIATAANANNFSYIGYHFGRLLHEKYSVPIGLYDISSGSSALFAWMSKEIWEAVGKPTCNKSPGGSPTACFNGMVYPVIGQGIKGVIWWQGEQDTWCKTTDYGGKFIAMINDWHKKWGIGNFPFLWVQLQASVAQRSWYIREGQLEALSVENGSMSVICDVACGIHPKGPRLEISRRLSLAAQALAHKENLVYCGPIIRGWKREGNKIRISFDHVAGGLELKKAAFPCANTMADDGGKPWQISADGENFVSAAAAIDGNDVLVSAPGVANPAHAKYAVISKPTMELFNSEGLPASPFNTATLKWNEYNTPTKIISQLKAIPKGKQHNVRVKSNSLLVDFAEPGRYNISIVSTNGQLLQKFSGCYGGMKSFGLSNISQSIYVVQINSDNHLVGASRD